VRQVSSQGRKEAHIVVSVLLVNSALINPRRHAALALQGASVPAGIRQLVRIAQQGARNNTMRQQLVLAASGESMLINQVRVCVFNVAMAQQLQTVEPHGLQTASVERAFGTAHQNASGALRLAYIVRAGIPSRVILWTRPLSLKKDSCH